MIVDSSALIAILKREPDWEAYSKELDQAESSRVAAATYVEIGIVVDSWKDPVLGRRLDELLNRFNITIEPFTAEQACLARQAFRDYGKGSGHPAGLNFGDCFSYAPASERREALLSKGDDFIHTDLRSALGEQ